MSENMIKIFNNDKFGSVRTVVMNNEPYFVGKDVTEILGYTNHSKAIADHVDEDDKLNNKTLSSLGQRGGWLINESGLYSLIFGSKLKDAKQFKHWVTSEVLPTIRKTGGYVSNDDLFINTYLPFADEPTKMLFRTTLTTINQLNAKIEKDRPLVEFAECVGVSEDCISMGEMAKIATKNGIKIGRTRLFELLRTKKILQRDNIPYQRYIEQQPWFKIRETVATIHGRPQIKFVTEVTPKGQKGILRMLKDVN